MYYSLDLLLFLFVYVFVCVLLIDVLLFWFGLRLAVKKGGGKQAAKKGKAAKDPNKPKRPASAFFIFMYEQLFSIFFRSVFVCIYVQNI